MEWQNSRMDGQGLVFATYEWGRKGKRKQRKRRGEKDDTVVKLCNESPFMMIKQGKKYPAHYFLPIIIQSKIISCGTIRNMLFVFFFSLGFDGFYSPKRSTCVKQLEECANFGIEDRWGQVKDANPNLMHSFVFTVEVKEGVAASSRLSTMTGVLSTSTCTVLGHVKPYCTKMSDQQLVCQFIHLSVQRLFVFFVVFKTCICVLSVFSFHIILL